MIIVGEFVKELVEDWKNGNGVSRFFLIKESENWTQKVRVPLDFVTPSVGDIVSYSVFLKPYYFLNKKVMRAKLDVSALSYQPESYGSDEPKSDVVPVSKKK